MKRPNLGLIMAAVFTVLIMGFSACQKTSRDASIAQAIKASFYSDPQLKAENIDVAVNKGEVTLSGEVSSDAARLQAFKLASAIAGVVKVTDQMHRPGEQAAQTVQPEAGAAAQSATPQGVTRPAPDAATRAAESKQTVPGQPARPAADGHEVSAAPAETARELETAKPAGVAEPAREPERAAAPTPQLVTIPQGTTISIRMLETVDSEKSKVGDRFRAEIDSPLEVQGQAVIPKGSQVTVRLAESKSAGKMTGRSELLLALDSLKFQEKIYALKSTSYSQAGSSRGKDTTKKVAIGAAVGAAIGAIAGGGKGAAIGAGAGAGGGAAVQILTKGQQVRIPPETLLDFKLEAPLEVAVLP